MKRTPVVLNVGGAKGCEGYMPKFFRTWQKVHLDINPQIQPDIVADMRKMDKLPAAKYDSVFSSHALEHVHLYEVNSVLQGFRHVLRKDGVAYVVVPDLSKVFKDLAMGKTLQDVFYQSAGGAITYHEVIYGWNKMLRSGELQYGHKCGFTEETIGRVFYDAGFASVRTATDQQANLIAIAFKSKPTHAQLRRFECQ